MPAAAARAAIRPSRVAIRKPFARNASTTEAASNAAAKAKDSASQATSKASEGLSKVQTSAGSAISKAGSATGKMLSGIGGRTGRVINFVNRLIPPTVYYSKVFWETSKIVFRGQRMQPPSLDQFQAYYQRAWRSLRNPSSISTPSANAVSGSGLLSTVRNISRQQMASGAVIVAELIGFFTIGEMIGKRKIVGYRGKVEHEH